MRLTAPHRLTLACECVPGDSLIGNGFDASAEEQIRAAWKGEPDQLIFVDTDGVGQY